MNEHFEILRKNYSHTKIIEYDDLMVYYGLGKHSKKTEQELNKIIQELNLPLIAINNETGMGLFSGTVRIEQKL